MEDASRPPALSDYIRVLDRRKWLLIGSWCLVVGLAVAYNELSVPVYSVEARLLLLPGGGASRVQGIATQLGLPDIQKLTGDRDMPTQVEILESQPLRDEALTIVVRQRNVLRSVRDGGLVEAALAELQTDDRRTDPSAEATGGRVRAAVEGLSVSRIANTAMASVTCESAAPEVAADAVNALCLAYLRANVSQLQAAVKRAGEDVSDQLAIAADKLAQAETNLQTFQEATGITSPDADAQMRAARVQGFAGALADAKAERVAREAAIERLKVLLRDQPETIVSSTSTATNPLLTSLESQLTSLEIERTGLLAKYKPGTPQIDAIDAQIAEVKERATAEAQEQLSEREESVNPLRQGLEDELLQAQIELASARARQTAVGGYLQDARKVVARVPAEHRRLTELARDATVAEQTYLTLKELQQRYAIAEWSQVPTAQLVQVGRPAQKPAKPDKRINILAGIAGGLLLGLALMLIAELVDDALHSPEEIERSLGLPVLGVIQRARDVQELTAWQYPDRGGIPEAMRTLRSNVAFASADRSIRALLVTGAEAGDGSTTIAANLAAAFAQAGSHVALVDADLRRPAVHELFGLDNATGLATVLSGGAELDEVLVASPVERLSLLTSGPTPPDPVALLESNGMRSVLETLGERYDLVVLDSPPAGTVADPQILGADADGILLVMELGRTGLQAVVDAKAVLERSQGNVLGIAANRARHRAAGRDDYRPGPG